MYPPLTLKLRFCEEVPLFVILSFIVFVLLDVTESFGLSYDFVTLFESSNYAELKYSTVKFELFR